MKVQALHNAVNTKIEAFQAGVARRAAARAADPSWFYERVWHTLRSWKGLKGALHAAAPSPWGAVTAFMIGSFLKSIIEQFAQVKWSCDVHTMGFVYSFCETFRFCVRKSSLFV